MPKPVYAFYDTNRTPKPLFVESSKVTANKLEIDMPVGVHMEKFRHLTITQVKCLTYVEAVSFEHRLENHETD